MNGGGSCAPLMKPPTVSRKDSNVSMVPVWTGQEVRILREASRMSVRAFAAHLGVSGRMVSKWGAT